jgi:anthranilate phosphoribosyltransferase
VEGGKKRYLDEFSTLGNNHVVEFSQAVTRLRSISPKRFPIQAATLADLAGGDRQANAEIVRRLLHGEDRGPKRDAVLLNSGAALYIAGKSRSSAAGWKMAAELIDSGKAGNKLKELIAASEQA